MTKPFLSIKSIAKHYGSVTAVEDGTVVGLLSLAAVLKTYGDRMEDHTEHDASILLHRRRLKVMVQGKQLFRKVMRRE